MGDVVNHAWTVINQCLQGSDAVHVRHREDGLVVATVSHTDGLWQQERPNVNYSDFYISLESALAAVEREFPDTPTEEAPQ